MTAKKRLRKSMTSTQFDNGYWYLAELKEFAQRIGIPSARRLRKNELEAAIQLFLATGEVRAPIQGPAPKGSEKDVDRGLHLDLPVMVYTNDKKTKDFLEREAQKLAPGSKRKSGAMYRLNRWREEQLARKMPLTYGDLVTEFARLNQWQGPFEQIPHGRYINFVADFFRSEENPTREGAMAAWQELKELDLPKNYRSWARSRRTRNG